MMGKTHIAVGIATSVLVMQPRSFEECILSVVGGSVGGILADIDILDNGSHDTLSTQLFAFGISAVLLAADYFFHLGICSGIMRNGTMFPTIGVVLFAMLCFAGILTPHRGFTHSIAGVLAYTAAVALIYPPFIPAFAVGYISHLALDLLNKKKLPLFYPLKAGFCLKLCYADGIANKIFLLAGTAVSVIMLSLTLIQLVLPLL